MVLASKVSFFFKLWKLWLKHKDHGDLRNSKTLSAQEAFVNQQCFIDIQISCHFIVLLIAHFRDNYSHLSIPLHLTRSDSCEVFFFKAGRMQDMERAYDFHELLSCAYILNQLATLECQSNGL